MRDIKFEFLYKGIPYSHINNNFNWHKKVYSLNDFINNSLHELCDMHGSCELVAKRQFTGLQDKNGVDIYEGDLLRIPAKNQYENKTYNCFEVFYHSNECIGGQNIGFCINRMHTQGNSGGGQGYKFTPESMLKHGFIVIGNIHQNKELLND